MVRKQATGTLLTGDHIRRVILQYFFDRNDNATSLRGKHGGAAVTISALRADLKSAYGLSRNQVVSNLTYLLSQGWVEEKPVSKTFSTPRGGLVPAVTPYYVITAAGIDKIAGPSEFMRDRFEGIRIEATGQNIITLGDGNRVNVRFRDLGEALADLRDAVNTHSVLDDSTKMDLAVDISCLQDQLARPQPNKTVVETLWAGIEKTAVAAGLVNAVASVSALIAGLIK